MSVNARSFDGEDLRVQYIRFVPIIDCWLTWGYTRSSASLPHVTHKLLNKRV
jgi:hypothetical protein